VTKPSNLLIAAWIAVLLLGVVGQIRAEPGSFPHELLLHCYRAVQLFVLEGDWTFELNPLPWELEVARVLAPLVAAASIILVLVHDAWVTLFNQRVRLLSGHVVLVGLDEDGWHFARACAEGGLRLAVIEPNEDNARIERARRLNVPVIVGDPLSHTALRRAGVHRAKDLVTFLDDAANVELTVSVKALLEGGERATPSMPLRVHCHMTDPQLAHGLEGYPKLFAGRELVETSFFNVDELAARKLARDQPMDVYADAMGRTRVHIVVVGASRMAREIILQTANTAHFATPERPRVTLCATGAPAFIERMCTIYPGLPQAVELATVEAPVVLHGLAAIAADSAVAGVSQYVICGRDDAESLAQALVLRRAVLLQRDVNAPILLHMRTSDGLTRMLESTEPDPEVPDGLCAFGTLDDVLNEETIINARQDDLARGLHETFLEQTKANRSNDPEAPSHVPWRLLSEAYRRDSRYEADHVTSLLRAIGCVEADVGATVEFTPAELERLAHIEKNRFIASRLVAGWRHSMVRSAFGRTTDLRPWGEIADHSYDLASAAAIPDLLRRHLGKGIRRLCVIGVTGHRTDRVFQHRNELVDAIDTVLADIVNAHPGAEFVVLSPLAEGADRLVARRALECIPNAQLHVPLPLPYEILTRDFGGHPSLGRAESIREFQELLGRAERYFEMPLKFGTLAELELSTEAAVHARAEQYALSGAFVVQRSHEVIAIWDGNDSSRIGGTAQVVSWRTGRVPERYRFAEAFFPPMPQREPYLVPPDASFDFSPARAPRSA
jgi:voltage-gated potassium channel Kch